MKKKKSKTLCVAKGCRCKALREYDIKLCKGHRDILERQLYEGKEAYPEECKECKKQDKKIKELENMDLEKANLLLEPNQNET